MLKTRDEFKKILDKYMLDICARMAYHTIRESHANPNQINSIIFYDYIPEAMRVVDFYEVHNYKKLGLKMVESLILGQKLNDDLLGEFNSILKTNTSSAYDWHFLYNWLERKNDNYGYSVLGKFLMIYSCFEQGLLPVVITREEEERYDKIVDNHDLMKFMVLAKDL
ncbi:hypothetical protein [Helicobacter sp. 13S00477-4]|uniref:hypothetical protein n=1 Tax=Helicobacter sp. 13S00477-4 TaxID=1905759 RepID=UPI000BA5120C|nr:hypothetical protein [Helicobacter sp. 13S00477-4]PAF52017.1 hypothetical protein BKH44_03845 [Helicobacter sp. 13S00477-4]